MTASLECPRTLTWRPPNSSGIRKRTHRASTCRTAPGQLLPEVPLRARVDIDESRLLFLWISTAEIAIASGNATRLLYGGMPKGQTPSSSPRPCAWAPVSPKGRTGSRRRSACASQGEGAQGNVPLEIGARCPTGSNQGPSGPPPPKPCIRSPPDGPGVHSRSITGSRRIPVAQRVLREVLVVYLAAGPVKRRRNGRS